MGRSRREPALIHSERKNFCARPFDSAITMNFGEYKICCDSATMGKVQESSFSDVWNGPSWKQVRESVLKDERHPACQTCWKKEDSGISTPRERGERFYPLMDLCSPEGQSSSLPKIVSLRLGNLCNLKCVMCAPFNSSKWAEDQDLFTQHVGGEQSYISSADLLESDGLFEETLAQVEHLTFIGGEPMLIKSHQRVIEYLINSGRSSQVTLKYFTNTTLLPEWCTKAWSQFKRIELRSSIDGTGDTYEYIRYPAKWSNVESIIKKINQLDLPDLDYGICYVFMSLNALDLENLFLWRNRFPWKITPPPIRPDYLVEPYFLRAEFLPAGVQRHVQDQLTRIHKSLTLYPVEKVLIQDLLSALNSKNTTENSSLVQLQSYLRSLDTRRKTSYQVLPTLQELL